MVRFVEASYVVCFFHIKQKSHPTWSGAQRSGQPSAGKRPVLSPLFAIHRVVSTGGWRAVQRATIQKQTGYVLLHTLLSTLPRPYKAGDASSVPSAGHRLGTPLQVG